MAEGARLESVFTGNRNVGSNPTPSATFFRRSFSAPRSPSPCLVLTQSGRCSRTMTLAASASDATYDLGACQFQMHFTTGTMCFLRSGIATRAKRDRMQTKDLQSLEEKRAYYRVLRYLRKELQASYREVQARPLPSRITDLLKEFEQRLFESLSDNSNSAEFLSAIFVSCSSDLVGHQ